VTPSSLPRLWEQGIPREGEDDRRVGAAMVLRVTTPCTEIAKELNTTPALDKIQDKKNGFIHSFFHRRL
jgi:hypothetical protein